MPKFIYQEKPSSEGSAKERLQTSHVPDASDLLAQDQSMEQSVFNKINSSGTELGLDRETVRTIAKALATLGGVAYLIGGLLGGSGIGWTMMESTPAFVLCIVGAGAAFTGLGILWKLWGEDIRASKR